MKIDKLIDSTLGEIVTEDYRTASVFKEVGLDFCCGGKKTLADACAEKDLDAGIVASLLERAAENFKGSCHDYKSWDPIFLADYIENTHHVYVKKSLPDLLHYTQKIAQVHRENHPELQVIAKIIHEVAKELKQHLKQEEEVLFPAIRELIRNPNPAAKAIIVEEITRMLGEHEFAGGSLDHINEITMGYALPEDACNTYRVAFELLADFEDDLHTHVHLENNLLFPKALQLANEN
jgi:regulator of cell morphogenesis and NO signaling